jgi:hypothetical protein
MNKRSKTIPIILGAAVLIAVPILGQWRKDRAQPRTPPPPASYPPINEPRPIVYRVIASDAPAWMHKGGPSVGTYLCNGTADNVKIQAAVDAVQALADDRGATIELSPGIFYWAQPVGETVVAGTGNLYQRYEGSATHATTMVQSAMVPVTWVTGTMTDVADGQIYRVTGGSSGGHSLEDHKEPLIASIEKKTIAATLKAGAWTNGTLTLTEVGAFKGLTIVHGDEIIITGGTGVTAGTYTIHSATDDAIVLHADINGAGGDINDVTAAPGIILSEPVQENYVTAAADFKRIVGSVKVTGNGITIRGSGIGATTLWRTSGVDCAAITFEGGSPSSAKVMFHVEDLSIQGNKADTTYDGDQAGIVVGERLYDYYQTNVAIWSTGGDGLVVLQPWGAHVTSGWIELCNGMGFVFGDGFQGMIDGLKLQGNLGNSTAGADTMPTMLLRYANKCYINPAQVTHDADYCIRLHTAQYNIITGASLLVESGGLGHIWIGGGPSNTSLYNSISNSMFSPYAATDVGITVVDYNYGHMVTGCWFSSVMTVPLSLGVTTNVTVQGCQNAGDILGSGGIQTRANDSAITVRSAIARVVGDGGAVVLDTAPAIADGCGDGQALIIQGTDDANTVQIADNCNCQLAGGAAVTLGKGDTITLQWNSVDSDWYELNRANN